MRPTFSIIIPTLNASAHFAQALRSLADQEFRDFEVLVVDGCSTDTTLELARAHEARLPRLHISSRADGGVYEAINRGVELSTGTWLLVLGSDDQLAAPDVLARAAQLLAQRPESFVYGDVRMMDTNPWVARGARYPGELSLAQLTYRNICQQSVFYRREIFTELGLFRAEFRICADWDYALRAFVLSSQSWVDLVVADYSCQGMSSKRGDDAFAKAKPELLAHLLRRRPLLADFRSLRWRYNEFARSAKGQGAWLKAIKHRLCFAWLAVVAGLTDFSKPKKDST